MIWKSASRLRGLPEETPENRLPGIFANADAIGRRQVR
jgi:hypothetical protein